MYLAALSTNLLKDQLRLLELRQKGYDVFVFHLTSTYGKYYFVTWPFLWSPYVIGQTIIFSCCGLFFFFFFLSFFSSPNLSRRRLDVCHTSTHVVALVQI